MCGRRIEICAETVRRGLHKVGSRARKKTEKQDQYYKDDIQSQWTKHYKEQESKYANPTHEKKRDQVFRKGGHILFHMRLWFNPVYWYNPTKSLLSLKNNYDPKVPRNNGHRDIDIGDSNTGIVYSSLMNHISIWETVSAV